MSESKNHIFSSGIDLKKSELINARLQNLFQFPNDPFEGQVIYRSDLALGAFYSGSVWKFFGVPPLAKVYDSEALMLADQVNQLPDYAYFDGLKEWRKLATSTGVIEDYREIGGSKIHNDLEEIQGGIEGERYHLTEDELLKLQEMPDPATGFLDTNAVHYDRDDAKTELEKAQARDNIDVFSRDEVKEITGELPDLNTADKTNLVSAINQKGQYRSAGW